MRNLLTLLPLFKNTTEPLAIVDCGNAGLLWGSLPFTTKIWGATGESIACPALTGVLLSNPRLLN